MPEFTQEQKDWICSVIDTWRDAWESDVIGEEAFKHATEILKQLIYGDKDAMNKINSLCDCMEYLQGNKN